MDSCQDKLAHIFMYSLYILHSMVYVYCSQETIVKCCKQYGNHLHVPLIIRLLTNSDSILYYSPYMPEAIIGFVNVKSRSD